MKMPGSILMALWILCIPFTVFTQNRKDAQDIDNNLVDKELIEHHEAESISQEKVDINKDKPLDINIFTGTNILFSKEYGSASSVYFGASALYPVTPRFAVEFGTAVNHSRVTDLPSGFFPENNASEPILHTTSVTLYTRGNYFLSPRLTLSGMAFKQFSPYKYPDVNPFFSNFNQEGMSIELNYKVFQNLHIGAQFNYIKSNGPFYPSRLSQPVFDNYYW